MTQNKDTIITSLCSMIVLTLKLVGDMTVLSRMVGHRRSLYVSLYVFPE